MQIPIQTSTLIKACACRSFFRPSAQPPNYRLEKNIKCVRFETAVILNGTEFVKPNRRSGTLCHGKSANITLHLLMCSGEEVEATAGLNRGHRVESMASLGLCRCPVLSCLSGEVMTRSGGGGQHSRHAVLMGPLSSD